MQKLKSHKSVEQIAKKHRMNVSDIQKQLDMGEPIEHEHTKDHKLAMDIALQHLDEIPDYYTRLKKMEASAKKEHKKFKDVAEGKEGLWANIHARRKKGLSPKKPGEKGYPKTLDIEEGLKQARKNVGASKCWPGKVATGTKMKDGEEVPDCLPIKEETGMVRYCPKCEKEETQTECKYGPKYWNMFSTPIALASNSYDPNKPHPANEEKDHEYSMARSEISTIIGAAKRLKKKMGKGEGNIEAWVQSKITKAADYLDTAADYVDSGEMKKEGVNERADFWHPDPEQDRKLGGPGANQRARQDGVSHSPTSKSDNKLRPGESYMQFIKRKKVEKIGEDVSIEDANGNHYAEFIDIIKPEPLKASRGIGSRLLGEGPSFEVGGRKSTGMKTMTPQDVEKLKQGNPGASSKIDNKYRQIRGEINLPLPKKEDRKEVQVSHFNMKTFGRFMTEAKKSEMKCNSPKAEPVGDSLTGKSHVVKACENGKEKLIRFGQRGVKGSPKKKGESKAYASRRHRFQTRHAKNIAKGKMSAAYWADKVKW